MEVKLGHERRNNHLFSSIEELRGESERVLVEIPPSAGRRHQVRQVKVVLLLLLHHRRRASKTRLQDQRTKIEKKKKTGKVDRKTQSFDFSLQNV